MRVLIIDRTTMAMGGIETNYASLIKYSLAKGYRVIWLTTKRHERNSNFKGLTDLKLVEKEYVRRTPLGPIYPQIRVKSDDEVTVLTNDILRYVICHKTLCKSGCDKLSHLLLIPHFTGAAIFPEEIFKAGKVRLYWERWIAGVVAWLATRGWLIGFDLKHLDACEAKYGITVSDKEKKVFHRVFSLEQPSSEVLHARAASRRNCFQIITCLRFDFPHKGYVFGLIKAFGDIHARHPETKLLIVGDGEGRGEVEKAILRLSPACRGAVELTGLLSPEQLKTRMLECSLNVGVAGAVLRGAECALPSIVMRHYTDEYEGYGLFEDVGIKLSDAQGEDMTLLTEKIINLSDEEYSERSIASFNKANEMCVVDPEFLFKQPRMGIKGAPMSSLKARLLFCQRLFLQKINGRPLYENMIDD